MDLYPLAQVLLSFQIMEQKKKLETPLQHTAAHRVLEIIGGTMLLLEELIEMLEIK